MPNFDWRAQPETLTDRFPTWVRGIDSWQRFVSVLSGFAGRLGDGGQAFRQVSEAYRQFLEEADRTAPAVRDCRVFVSHQRNDVDPATRIAWLAVNEGFEYWLDVHDPGLKATNNAQLSGPAKAFAIAAIIEIALLNCSHVIGVQTAKSRTSRWVPYEFGRGKRPVLASPQAASWFAPGVTLDPGGDYLSLCRQTFTEGDVTDWFREESALRTCHSMPGGWNGDVPPELPKP